MQKEITNVALCTSCGAGTIVVDSRLTVYGDLTVRKRRRECVRCGCRFTTCEVPRSYLLALLESKKLFRKVNEAHIAALSNA